LGHDHLLGDQQPTKEDHKITEEWYIRHLSGGMIEVGRLMKIPLKDHVIIGQGWFSFFERSCGVDD
jgi:DNA repair protein RadC